MKNSSIAVISAMFAVLSCSAFAESTCASKVIFSCTTTKGKTVEVCDAGSTIKYSFGKKGAPPEMVLAIPRAAASTHQWDGMGRYMSYNVQIPNGNTVYEVFSSVDKIEQEITSGINVEIAGKHAATLTCKPGTGIDNIEGVELPPAD
ncbi:MAG: hypothetical protein E6Q87_01330 [Cellvibrionales bacterium]|nr:MAG: hypothetical protein E6Q87_01330 [Cellvibrionales bacterium]